CGSSVNISQSVSTISGIH
ncbi:MAG: hypothetical protein EZS28_047530, partial [Streblomastix strix]